MKQLKIILQSKIFYYLLLLLSIIYCYLYISNLKIDVKDEKELIGIIISIEKKDDYVEFVVKNNDKVIVNYYDDYINLNLGDKVKVVGEYKKINNNTVFNVFNYKNYLFSKNIKYMFEADEIIKLRSNNNIFYSLKNKIIEYIETYKSKDYLKAFIIGDNDINNVYKESYQTNGISHLFSISGLHVSLFTLIISKVLSVFIKKKKNIFFINYIFLLFYIFLTSFSKSVIRSSLLYILASLSDLFDFNIKRIYLLILIFSCFLFINPYNIYNVGFLFSFIVSFYLILYSDLIKKYKNYFIKIFMISLIAFLSSLPISINNFFEINLLSAFLNIIFVPLISIFIFPLSLLSLLIKPLDSILYFSINIIEYISLCLSKINIFVITLRHINIVGIIIYYLVINFILYSFFKNKYYNIIYFLVIIFIHYNINYLSSSFIVAMLNVNQGDSILIKLPYNKGNILIDTGGYYNSNIILNRTIPYLKSIGIKKINYFVITHGDYDHMGEAINLVEKFKVEKVIFNCGEFNELEQKLIKVLDKKKIQYYSCIKELNINDNKLYFLNNKDYGNENENSSVIYTELNHHKFLFMGDAGVEVEEDLIKKYNLKNIDVLKVGHHGSKTSSSKNFIDEINPKYSIISVGKNNRYGHPNKEVLNNLEYSKIYRTDKDGSIMLKIKNDKLKIETCVP